MLLKIFLVALMMTAGAIYAAMTVHFLVTEETIMAALATVVSTFFNAGAESIRKGTQ